MKTCFIQKSLPRTLYGRIEDELLATFCKWTIPRWWNYVTPRTKRGTTDAECRGANPPKADETKEAEGRGLSEGALFQIQVFHLTSTAPLPND